eukprot:1075728-Ditylum_brightwellii.AAC.1
MNLAVRRGRCVILATHQHQFIGNECCILMENGSVKCFGSYSDCVDSSNGILTSTLQTSEEENDALELQNNNILLQSPVDKEQD